MQESLFLKKGQPLLWVYLSAALFYLINWYVSPGFNGGADSITHYQISKYCWNHDYLLLDQWGKPVFTILFSPIAHFGFKAVAAVNIILIFLGAHLAYKIAQLLSISNAWIASLFVLWTPIVTGNAVSGLTEPICSMFLILFLFWGLKEKWILASVVLSFMPFARSEGFVIIALAMVFFSFTKRFKYIPFLLVGSLIFNTLGYLQTGKALWIFDSNPYVNTGIKVYGHGTFYHFFLLAVPIFGWMFIPVVLYTLTQLNKVTNLFSTNRWSNEDQVLFWLVLGSFWGYFLAHSVLWWQGMWASLGLIRVMFVIAVPMSLLAAKWWDLHVEKWTHPMKVYVYPTLIALTVAGPFILKPMGFQEIQIFPQLGQEEYTNIKVADYLKSHVDLIHTKTFTGHPYLNLVLDIDPFDTAVNDRIHNWQSAQPGDIVVWDGHFGPNEEQVFKEQLEKDSSFRFLATFTPDVTYYTLNNYLYDIRLFQKK
jgi:hypothetical protein